jgi:hypothetical protein
MGSSTAGAVALARQPARHALRTRTDNTRMVRVARCFMPRTLRAACPPRALSKCLCECAGVASWRCRSRHGCTISTVVVHVVTRPDASAFPPDKLSLVAAKGHGADPAADVRAERSRACDSSRIHGQAHEGFRMWLMHLTEPAALANAIVSMLSTAIPTPEPLRDRTRSSRRAVDGHARAPRRRRPPRVLSSIDRDDRATA